MVYLCKMLFSTTSELNRVSPIKYCHSFCMWEVKNAEKECPDFLLCPAPYFLSLFTCVSDFIYVLHTFQRFWLQGCSIYTNLWEPNHFCLQPIIKKWWLLQNIYCCVTRSPVQCWVCNPSPVFQFLLSHLLHSSVDFSFITFQA